MYVGGPAQFCACKVPVIHYCWSLNCMILVDKQNVVEDEAGEIAI